MHPACLPVEQLLVACSIRNTRRGGPGGQHRNKVETAVVIAHDPSGVVAEASELRSQAANRAVAVFRLRLKLAVEIDSQPFDGLLAPSTLWNKRSRNGKLNVSPEHADYPALLAELMACLRQCNCSLRVAAAEKHVTASQLIKLLKLYPPAFKRVNADRESMSLRKLV